MFARDPAPTSVDSLTSTTHHQNPLHSISPSVYPSPAIEIVGAELVDELAMQTPILARASHTKVEDCHSDQITKAELQIIRKSISQTTRPSWHRGPPINIGAPGAGKLKADQWRSCIEFDLVVAVARLYSAETPKKRDSSAAQRRYKLFETTMYLALAVRWGTSTITSPIHANKYAHYMRSYLENLLALYPERLLLPNHHAALHIPEFLLLFGPSPGWWMFPYERLIGRLQVINTNNKMGKIPRLLLQFLSIYAGQLESTMMRSFCAGTNLKAYLHREDCAPVLKMSLPILNPVLQKQEFQNASHDSTCLPPVDKKDMLSSETRAALTRANEQLSRLQRSLLAEESRRVESLVINGLHFTTRSHLVRNSAVLFRPLNSQALVPGYIDSIRVCKSGEHWVSVRRLLGLSPPLPTNPFNLYPEFGAELWSDKLSPSIEVIPVSQPMYHCASQPWSKGVLVVKCLNRVCHAH